MTGPAVNRSVSIVTHRGKKSGAKQMTLERWRKKSPQWCRMSVPSLDSVHVVCRFAFSYPAMNFSFCRFTHHPSHTTLSHIIFHTQLCHTLSFTNNFHTHTHTIFHTHNFVTHTHTIFLCHTPSFTYSFVTHTHNFVLLLDPPPPPFSFLPSPSLLPHFLLIIGRSWLVGLSGPLMAHFIGNLFPYFLHISYQGLDVQQCLILTTRLPDSYPLPRKFEDHPPTASPTRAILYGGSLFPCRKGPPI